AKRLRSRRTSRLSNDMECPREFSQERRAPVLALRTASCAASPTRTRPTSGNTRSIFETWDSRPTNTDYEGTPSLTSHRTSERLKVYGANRSALLRKKFEG